MGKLTVKDIENRLLWRIFDKTGNESLQSNDLEQAMVDLLSSQNERIARQAGQIAAYQKMADYNLLLEKCKSQEALIASLSKPQTETKGDKLYLCSVSKDRWLEAIKLVRELTGLGLKEAKDLVDKVRGRYFSSSDYGSNPLPPEKQLLPLYAEYGGSRMPALIQRFAEIGALVEVG